MNHLAAEQRGIMWNIFTPQAAEYLIIYPDTLPTLSVRGRSVYGTGSLSGFVQLTNCNALCFCNLSFTNNQYVTDHNWLRRYNERYSESTIRTYTGSFCDFINYYSKKDLQEISGDDIKAYLLYLVEKRKVSVSFQNQVINAIKFYYEKVLGGTRMKYITIDRPFRERALPSVLSEEEVTRIISSLSNVKHKAILLTIYSAGLRISEVINLKIKDIDSNRKAMIIKGAKGKKDRNSILSEKLLLFLREYFKQYKPKVWLFEGHAGAQYSESSIQQVFRKAVWMQKL